MPDDPNNLETEIARKAAQGGIASKNRSQNARQQEETNTYGARKTPRYKMQLVVRTRPNSVENSFIGSSPHPQG
jgi:hypothetical protein